MRKLFLMFVCLAAVAPAVAAAQSPVVTGIGPRFGFSTGPDQLVLGGHLIIGEVAPKITFDPSIDLGLGSDRTTLGLNFDLHYHFEIQDTAWRPYAGAGVGIHFTDRDLGASVRDQSSTDVGGAFILGAGVPTKGGSRFFGELKLGFGGPDLKLLAGWNFRL